MAYARHSKCRVLRDVWVRVPPPALVFQPKTGRGRGRIRKVRSLIRAIGRRTDRNPSRVWELVHRQHGAITRAQLRDLGFTDDAIDHRIARGRLRRLHRGVFVVGGRDVDQLGRWSAAVLACGPDALLSHQSAAALWRIRRPRAGPIEVSVPAEARRRPDGGPAASEFTGAAGSRPLIAGFVSAFR
jgi:Transcriptional regulator, AbiEi antitoxin